MFRLRQLLCAPMQIALVTGLIADEATAKNCIGAVGVRIVDHSGVTVWQYSSSWPYNCGTLELRAGDSVEVWSIITYGYCGSIGENQLVMQQDDGPFEPVPCENGHCRLGADGEYRVKNTWPYFDFSQVVTFRIANTLVVGEAAPAAPMQPTVVFGPEGPILRVPVGEPASVEIFRTNGQLTAIEQLRSGESEMSLPELPPGLYVLCVRRQERVFALRFTAP